MLLDYSILAAYDLADRKTKTVEEQHVSITSANWTEYLGEEKYYASLLSLFSGVIAKLGAGETIEQYVFSPAANGNGTNMLLRFVGGAVHPTIQTGYGVEFGSDAMVAQALAQTAIHSPFYPGIFDLRPQANIANGHSAPTKEHRQPSHGKSLLAIIREAYDSEIMHPVMPYDPDAFLRERFTDAYKDGRPEEIVRLANLWYIDVSRGQKELDEKLEELIWLATLLLAGTGKPGRKPRLDFFLMHILNVTLFIPSLLKAIPTVDSKVTLLRAVLPVILMYMLVRGRPRIDPSLLMSYTTTPRPPLASSKDRLQPDKSSIGDPTEDKNVNPWPEIIASVLHAPDAHTVKAIRALYYGAQHYGTTPPGGAIGAFQPDGTETHDGMAKADGTIFIRAAGVVMDTLGWVSHGQAEGAWDRSALGWDDAWKGDD
ncbi:hypothetical protein EW026_g7119 [Hermanssonia centrifuga]|uniref:Uncharacterized protein n=1 Tax=Hermanssonia centrifuga TaxID=98765 RepID=A0A4S4K8U0_9APHY|nr:hypothetical protein EW026_g7119 [Hermanssonia centrifuga]